MSSDDPLRQGLRRLAWRVAQLVGMGPVTELVYSGRYVFDVARSLADPHRADHILTFLASEGLVRRGGLHWPHAASFEQLCRVHTAAYLEGLREPGALTRILGMRLAAADEDRFVDLQRYMVGGTLLATRTALQTGRIAINLGGGLHHAHPDRGGGFCVLNDVAVAITTFRQHGYQEPVLVVDLDLHDGDGTRAVFARDSTVHTFSVHNQPWEDDRAVESTSVALGDDVGDEAYLEALRAHLPRLLARFRPALVFYLAGCDPAADDVLGNWQITPAGLLARDRYVVEQLRRAGSPPTVVTLAGGYGSEAWRYSARFFGWLLSADREIEVPSTDEVTLRRYRVLSTLVSPADLTGPVSENDFGLTEEDVLGALATTPRETRFLGYYSRHGLELALERLGLLPRLRSRGFPQPTLDFGDLDNPAGQTLRVFGDPDKTELLAELRARRDQRTVPGMSMLRVEWLLLQNPRERFGPGRQPLPGQKHPGLGMLRDAAAMLILICDRLGLDGVLFVPSHYHLASQAGEVLAFLEPEDAARFDAFHDAVADLPLAEATRAVDEGRVIDHATGESARWVPAPMVLPISDRLEGQMATPDRQERREEARSRFDYRLARIKSPAIREPG